MFFGIIHIIFDNYLFFPFFSFSLFDKPRISEKFFFILFMKNVKFSKFDGGEVVSVAGHKTSDNWLVCYPASVYLEGLSSFISSLRRMLSRYNLTML